MEAMAITDLLKQITCISEFEDRPLEDDLLATIVEGASWTPSAADVQPWEMVAVRTPERKEAMVKTLLDSHLRPRQGGDERRSWLAQAPAILVVCLDHTRAKARYGEIGEKLFGIQDTGAAIQNLRLVALEHGVKSCLVREFDHRQMGELLQLPRHVEAVMVIALGYSEAQASRKPGLRLQDYFHLETW
jgi:nitroreductase